jgi:Zn-dependent protease
MKTGINVLLTVMIIGSFLLAIALHEFAHAIMASWLGDRTPRNEGRQSLSLRTHLDPMGTLMCVILALQPIVFGPVGIGWGKPVKPDPWKMKVGANTGVLMVAWAGPIFNLLIGLLFAFLLRFLPHFFYTDAVAIRLPQLLLVFASVNICVTLLNLLPFYPLDGYQIVYTLLPSRQAVQFAKSGRFGPFIILGIFFLVPFLTQLAGMGALFQIPNYFLQGSLHLIALVTGPYESVTTLYSW